MFDIVAHDAPDMILLILRVPIDPARSDALSIAMLSAKTSACTACVLFNQACIVVLFNQASCIPGADDGFGQPDKGCDASHQSDMFV